VTLDQFVDLIFVEEGSVYAEPPQIDQPTGPGGIILATLEADRGVPCTVDDLKALTIPDARAIITRKVARDATQFRFDQVGDEHLQIQLLDFAYNSGPVTAVKYLQRVLGFGFAGAPIDGVIGPQVILSLSTFPPAPMWKLLVNNSLAALRAAEAWNGTLVAAKFAEGVAHRAIRFVVLP
jgi:lysozyme family protein